MKSLKSKRIFVLIWLAILVSLLSSVYLIIQTFIQNPQNKIGSWITIARSITGVILLVMSINLWKIVRSYSRKNEWQPQFYNKIRAIGFWSVAVTLISPTFQTLIYYKQFMNHLTSFESKLDAIWYTCLLIFANSALMWFFSLSIFLFAELLQIANQIKTENESII